MLIGILSVVALMFIVGFLMVPFYNWMAKMDGVNGKWMTPTGKLDCGTLDVSRVITVEMSTSLHGNLNFAFTPQVGYIDLHPGQIEKINFIAKNNTGHNILVQCMGSVAPGVGSRYFEVVQDICAKPQFFARDETHLVGLQFYINSKMPKYIKSIILNLTLADANRGLRVRGSSSLAAE